MERDFFTRRHETTKGRGFFIRNSEKHEFVGGNRDCRVLTPSFWAVFAARQLPDSDAAKKKTKFKKPDSETE
jgi:hypothetical protein